MKHPVSAIAVSGCSLFLALGLASHALALLGLGKATWIFVPLYALFLLKPRINKCLKAPF